MTHTPRGLKSSEWLREHIFPTAFESEILLDAMRFGWGMTELERQAVWVLLSDTVYSAAKRHYKQAQVYGSRRDKPREWYDLPNPDSTYVDRAQKGFDAHTERILILVEFLQAYPDRSAGWCVVAWKRRFAQFEELRHFRTLGIHIDVKDVQKREVRDAVYIGGMLRRLSLKGNGAYNTVVQHWKKYEEEHGRPITDKRIANFAKRWDHYQALLERTKYALSYDEIPRSNNNNNDDNGEFSWN